MSTDKQTERRAGIWIALLSLLLLAALAVYGIISLMGNGLRTLETLGNASIGDTEYALDPVERPTRPPEADSTPEPAETAANDTVWQDVPVVSTPEQLAQTASNATPPPDAPIG